MDWNKCSTGWKFVCPDLIVSTETVSTDVTGIETFVFPDLFAGTLTFPTYITVAELMSAASSIGSAKKSPGLSKILIGLGVENTLLYDSWKLTVESWKLTVDMTWPTRHDLTSSPSYVITSVSDSFSDRISDLICIVVNVLWPGCSHVYSHDEVAWLPANFWQVAALLLQWSLIIDGTVTAQSCCKMEDGFLEIRQFYLLLLFLCFFSIS